MTFPYTLHNDSTAVITPEIPLESKTSGELKTLIEQLLARGIKRFVIDAHKTDYVSSEGLYTLFTVQKSIRSGGGTMVIARPSQEVRSLFQVLQLSEFVPITDSMDGALKMAETGFSESAKTNGYSGTVSQQPVEGSFQPETTTGTEEKSFDPPLVVECESCNAFIRIHSSGRMMCPSCKTEFDVVNDGTVVF